MVGKGKREISRMIIEKHLGKIVGIIPFDREVVESIDRGIPYVLYNPYSKITTEFVKIAEYVTGDKFKLKRGSDKKRFGGFGLC